MTTLCMTTLSITIKYVILHNNKICDTQHNNKNDLLSIILCQVSSLLGVKMLKVILPRVNKIKSVIFRISPFFAAVILASIKYKLATNAPVYCYKVCMTMN